MPASSSPLVIYNVEDQVAQITLNRPQKRNALNRELWSELDAAFARAYSAADVRVIILAAEGPTFCAGADLSPGEDPTEATPWNDHFKRHYRRQMGMWHSDKIIICSVQGHCIGRGLELALWCDIVVASEDARLGQPEIREGWLVHSVVPWLIGPQKAKLFMLSGDVISARQAETLGLVTKVVEEGQALVEAQKLARRLTHVPPFAAIGVKEQVNATLDHMGFAIQQASGVSTSAFTSGLSARERGTEEIERVRREKGFKASIEFRDAPFKE
jgi:enoyl-CoA hydratase